MDVREVVEERAQTEMSRRNLFKGASVVAVSSVGVASIAGPAAAATTTVKAVTVTSRIVVVGGGISGLSGALVLQDAGCTSTIHRGSMEGGAMEGPRAAGEIIADVKAGQSI